MMNEERLGGLAWNSGKIEVELRDGTGWEGRARESKRTKQRTD